MDVTSIMKKINIILFLTFITISFAARGDIVSVELLSTKSVSNNQTYIEDELSSTVTDQFSLDPVSYGYRMYKIAYETIDAHGNFHIATGTIAFPRVDWPDVPNEAFPIISYQHGTVLERSSVSSVSGVWILPAFLAGSGYVYLEPDYLGLGDSEGMHPYQIKEPYGTAVIDLIRAAKQYSEQNNQFTINEQLFLVGYSEGGYATMATHQIIERDYSDEFEITASFPMAGAYSMSEIMVDVMLSMVEYGEPFYFPYVLFAYEDSYPEIGSVVDYLLPEYWVLEDMFDGYTSSTVVNEFMPSIPMQIMIPDSIQSFQDNYNHPLKVALRANDLWDWLPQSPMYIFHGIADELVPVENADLAYNQFIENGATDVYLEYIPSNFGGHADAAPWALLGAFEFAQDMAIIDCLVDVDCNNECGGSAVLDDCDVCNGDNSTCAMVGDLNGDLTINVLDVVLLVNLIFDNAPYTEIADLNNDQLINVLDVVLLVGVILPD